MASSIAPEKSPSNTFLIAVPKKPIVSIAEEILFVTFSTKASLKSISACLGFVIASNIAVPKFANASMIWLTTAPSIAKPTCSFSCPSSLLLKAATNEVIRTTKAPIPVAIKAIFKRLIPLTAVIMLV